MFFESRNYPFETSGPDLAISVADKWARPRATVMDKGDYQHSYIIKRGQATPARPSEAKSAAEPSPRRRVALRPSPSPSDPAAPAAIGCALTPVDTKSTHQI